MASPLHARIDDGLQDHFAWNGSVKPLQVFAGSAACWRTELAPVETFCNWSRRRHGCRQTLRPSPAMELIEMAVVLPSEDPEAMQGDPLDSAIGLLSQHVWCWGQDILRPEGDWLLAFSRQPKSLLPPGAHCRFKSPPTSMLIQREIRHE